MPIKIDGRTYYRSGEVCQIVNIGKSTLFRWIKGRVINEATYKDRRGWRLFTEGDVEILKNEAERIQ